MGCIAVLSKGESNLVGRVAAQPPLALSLSLFLFSLGCYRCGFSLVYARALVSISSSFCPTARQWRRNVASSLMPERPMPTSKVSGLR